MADEKKATKEEAKPAVKKPAEAAKEPAKAPVRPVRRVAAQEPPAKKAPPPAPKEEEEAMEPDDAEAEEEAREGEEPEAKPRKAKRAAKPAKEDEDDEEEADEKAPKRAKRPRPALTPEVQRALKQRSQISHDRPDFFRQEWFRYQRLGEKWRAPQGIQSKMRRHWGTHADVVSIGYRGPRAARGLHPSGFREVLVHNPDNLEGVNPKEEAVRIASSVGWRNREAIQKQARKLGIRVLNWKDGDKR